MLFDRQRVLLELLDALNERMGSTDFQKLLFLYTREGESIPSYDFVPYRFGCFSLTSYADKRRLVEEGLVEDGETWKLTDKGRRVARCGERSPLPMARFAKQYKNLRGNALVADVYQRYPYFATRSEILEKVLPKLQDRARVEAVRPAKQSPGLVTVGYESKTLEAYLNQLLHDGVSLLCDVRHNPLSRKYGFSKSTLNHACEVVGIRYEHLPQLGIPSEKRENLKKQTDYDLLFATYERTTLAKQTQTLVKIASWIKSEDQRVALTCFELLPHQCHRHCVAKAMEKTFGPKFVARHL